jgi:hypothetical protein
MALSKEAREYFAKEGRKGGKAYVKNSTPEERKAAAQKAANARWSKDKKAIEKSIRTINENLDQIESPRKRPKAPRKA